MQVFFRYFYSKEQGRNPDLAKLISGFSRILGGEVDVRQRKGCVSRWSFVNKKVATPQPRQVV